MIIGSSKPVVVITYFFNFVSDRVKKTLWRCARTGLGFALGLGRFLVALGPKFKKSRCIITSARFLGCLDLEICLYVWRSRWWKTHRWTHRVTTLQFLVSSIKWLVFFCCLLVYRSYRKENTQFWIVFQNKKLGWSRLIPTSEDLCWFTLLQCK